MDVLRRSATLKGFLLRVLLLGVVVLPSRPAKAQDTDVSGRVYADYYWVAASHDAELEGRNGFWFRRIYLTFDHEIVEHWAIRLRGEMDQPGTFTSDDEMIPTVKDAYLRWENEQHAVFLGLAPTPTWSLLEDMWGYRSVEKTPLDLYEFGSSRDIGLSVRGHLGSEQPVRYHAMLANGSGTGTEINTGKKAMLSLAVSPQPSFTVEVYGDIEEETGDQGYYTLQGALYYQRPEGRFGLQYAHQTRYQDAGPDVGFDLLSVFGRARLNERVNALARVDHQFQPNPFAGGIDYLPFSTTAEATFVVAGLDFALTEQVRLIPNVEAVFYGEADSGVNPDPEVLPRLTFYYWF